MRTALRPWLVATALALPAFPAPAQAPPAAKPAAPAEAIAAPQGAAPAVAATVNGQPISEVAVQRGLERVPPARRAEARPDLLNFLIDNALVDQYLLQMQVAVDKAEVDKRLQDMRAAAKKEGEDFDKALQKLHLTEAELREHVAFDLRWEGFVNKQADDKKLREMFDANKEMFDGSMCRARHILLTPPPGDAKAAAEAQAKLQQFKQQVEAQVAAGLAKLPADADKLAREKARATLTDEAFAALARKESACPSKEQGGDVNWFQRAGVMVEPFARAAFARKPFEMTDVVPTQFGYHLILVTERKPGREVKYEDVKEVVKDVYADRLREAVVAQMRPRAKVAITPAAKP